MITFNSDPFFGNEAVEVLLSEQNSSPDVVTTETDSGAVPFVVFQ